MGVLRPAVRVIGFSQSWAAGYTRDAGSRWEFMVGLFHSRLCSLTMVLSIAVTLLTGLCIKMTFQWYSTGKQTPKQPAHYVIVLTMQTTRTKFCGQLEDLCEFCIDQLTYPQAVP